MTAARNMVNMACKPLQRQLVSHEHVFFFFFLFCWCNPQVKKAFYLSSRFNSKLRRSLPADSGLAHVLFALQLPLLCYWLTGAGCLSTSARHSTLTGSCCQAALGFLDTAITRAATTICSQHPFDPRTLARLFAHTCSSSCSRRRAHRSSTS